MCAVAVCNAPPPANADFDARVLDSVVRLKPDWPAAARGRTAQGAPRDPQGTGVVVHAGGYIATNVHVIGEATAIEVLMHDGRTFQAEIVGRHPPTDIALIKIDADPPVLETAPPPPLAAPVCAVGNQFGLGLSVTCGVVSAVNRSGTGFNPIEDFIQTDASINPGGSGGALVDGQSRLVGMVSAIFTKESDADIGVNFAASAALMLRVAEDLRLHGRVIRADPGFRAAPVPQPLSSEMSGVMIESVDVEGPAFAAGLEAGDIVTHFNDRPVTGASAFEAALFMVRDEQPAALVVRRGDDTVQVSFTLQREK